MKTKVQHFIDRYIELCESIAEGRVFYPLFTKDQARFSGCNSFIDYDKNTYQYGSYERGNCTINFESSDIYECMYHPIYDATWKLASDYELLHRIEGQDSRILSFKTWLSYMKKINMNWAEKLEIELNAIASADGLNLK